MLYPLSYERLLNQMFYPLDLTSDHLLMLTSGLVADATVRGCAAPVQENLIRGSVIVSISDLAVLAE
jgi:hypothetical protein